MLKRMLLVTAAAAAALAAAVTAGAERTKEFRLASTTPSGPTSHFPGFDAGSGNVLVSNVSAGQVTEVEPGAGPVRTFAAQTQPHTVVVDAAARRAYVTNKGSATVSVLDLRSGATLTSFPVGPNPHGLVVDASRGRLYVTSIDADRVESYDLSGYARLGSAQVGDGPWGVDVRDDVLVVTDTASTTIHLLDPDTLEVEEVVEVGAGPWNAKIGPSGTIYVTLERSGELVAVRNGRVAWRTAVGPSPHGIVVDESRHVVLAAATGANAVAVVKDTNGRLLQNVSVPPAPAGMSYDFSSGVAYAASQGAGVLDTLVPLVSSGR